MYFHVLWGALVDDWVKGVLIVFGGVVGLLVVLGFVAAFFTDRVCVERTILGNPGDVLTVTLKINVNSLRAPRAFFVEETLPQGWKVLTTVPDPTVTSQKGSLLSWFFWRGEGVLPVADQTIVYTVRSFSQEGIRGVLRIANAQNASEYLALPLRGEKTCA
jgi:hypothetical protein